MATKTKVSATLDAALKYAREGFPVFPVHSIVKSAPPRSVEQWRAGKLDKKAATAQAKCSCGKHPCKSPGKHPKTKNGAKDATTDESRIRRWFTSAPESNIGIVMPPGFVALDFDLYVPGASEKLEALRLQRVTTLEQESGAGGVHLIFCDVPDSVKLGSTLDSESGVDLIHEGNRYLVAAPSRHWSGGEYRWRNNQEPVPLPKQLTGRVTQGAPRTRPIERAPSPHEEKDLLCPLDWDGTAFDWAVELAANLLPPAVSNDEPDSLEPGHVTLARAACHLIAGCGLDESEALEILWEEYNPRCVPPWDEDERDDFERTVSGAGAHVDDVGYLVPPDHVKRLAADADERARERGRQSTPKDEHGIGRLLSFLEPEVPLDYWCEGLCLASSTGKISLVAGEPGAGKGPIVDHLAVCFALGLKAFGACECKRANVLLIDCEGAGLTMRRIRRLAAALGREPAELDGRLHVSDASGENLVTDAYHDQLEAYVSEHAIDVVILDSYTSAVMGSGVDANQPEFALLAKMLGALGILVIAVAHANKEAAKRNDKPQLSDIAYSGAFGAMAQTAIVVWRPDRSDPNTVHVGCARAPEEEFAAFAVRFQGDKTQPLTVRQVLASPVEAPEAARVRKHRETVCERADRIESILRGDGGPISAQKVAKVRSLAGLSGDNWGEALRECLRRGSVHTVGGGLSYVPPDQRGGTPVEDDPFAARRRERATKPRNRHS